MEEQQLATPAPPSHSTISAHFHELKVDLSSLNAAFSVWSTEKRRCLTEDKQAYLKTLSEEHDAVEALIKQYNQLQIKRQQLLQALENEQKEYEEGLTTNTELRTQQSVLYKKLDVHKATTAQLQQTIQKDSNLLLQREKMREAMVKRMQDLLALYQQYLGLYVDPIDPDVTRFTFVNIDADDWTRRFTFVVSVAENYMKVTECSPMVDDLELMQEDLNSTGDFFGFLKAMRKRFSQLPKSS